MYTHRYLAATNMNSTTKIQNFRHLQWETYTKPEKSKLWQTAILTKHSWQYPLLKFHAFICITSVKYQLIAITNGH